MFATWADAATAVAVVLAVNVIATLLAGARDNLVVRNTVAARFGALRAATPKHAQDLRSGIVGEQRDDGHKRRQALVLVLAVAAATQALPLNGYLAGGLVFCAWSLFDTATRAYEKALFGIAGERIRSTRDMSSWEELIEIFAYVLAPSEVNPLRGRWRPLGVATGAISVGLALAGWAALLAAFGVRFRDVADGLGELIRTDSPILLGIAGAAGILLARAPLDLAIRYALAHPAPARHYPIVYLRSFQDDGLSIGTRGPSRGIVDRLTVRHRLGYERLLVASMQHFGPVVAIGEPRERLPPTGAFRLYYDDDEWQAAVTRMLLAASYIVLSVGETPSVGWEIAKLKDLRLLDRSVFLVPPVRDDARRKRLALLAGHLGTEPALLESPEGGVMYVGVMFDDGRAVPLAAAAYDYASYYSAIFEAGFRHFEGSREVADVPISAKAGRTTSSDLSGSTIAALHLAATRRGEGPLNTFQMLCALLDADVAGPWRKALMAVTDVATDDYRLLRDSPADVAGDWAGVPLTAHAAAALRIAAKITRRYDLGLVPPEALALGLVADASSAASQALVQKSRLSHAELAKLLRNELPDGGPGTS